MPRPAARRPTAPTEILSQPTPTPRLAPAADNGQPFGGNAPTAAPAAQPAPPAATPTKRAGKQLGLRIPDALYARLVACAEETGIPQSTLVRRALDRELKDHQH